MKKFKFLLTAMLLTCSSMSFAQFMNGGSSSSSSSDVPAWKGLRFSYDRTFISADDESAYGKYGLDIENMNGFSIGYVHSFNIAKSLPIFLETGAGINYARYSESESEEDAEVKLSLNTLGLTIPINFVYGVNVNDKLTIKPFTGLYLRANLMGNASIETTYDGEKIDELSDDFNLFDKDDMGDDGVWNRVQVGWQIGTTLDINKFNVGISYALDFNEIAEETKTSKFSVNLGYNF